MDIQNKFRLNRVVLDIIAIEHLINTRRIDDKDALRNLNKAFDTLIDIRFDCPDEDIEGYVEKVWNHIERLSGVSRQSAC